jgi:DNA-binding PadR family transcriptional regulator
LGVLTALQIDGPADFTTLTHRLEAADGAMGIHLRKLEDTGYISCKKSFVGRRPKSTYRITPQGRQALLDYLDTMQKLVDAVDAASKSK